MLYVLWTAIIAGACAVAASVFIYVLAELNLRLHPQSLWFPAPVIFVAIVMLMKIENRIAGLPIAPPCCSSRIWARVGALVLAVTALGLLLSGWDQILDGSISLRGDHKPAPRLFQAAFSFVIGLAGALVEEAAVRGLFQLRVKPAVGEAFSQSGALVIFLALHGTAVAEPKRLLFLIVVGLSSGYLASTTRSILAPAAFHASVNVAIAGMVLALRP